MLWYLQECEECFRENHTGGYSEHALEHQSYSSNIYGLVTVLSMTSRVGCKIHLQKTKTDF